MDRERQSFTNCLRRIEVEYGRDGWHGDDDVEPVLYAIHRERDRLRAVRLGVDSRFWDKGPPGLVLTALAHALPDHADWMILPFVVNGEWVGLALAMETWYLQADYDDPAYTEEIKAVSAHRLINQHPDRKTMRLVYGITRSQERVMVARTEDEDVQRVEDEATFPGTVTDGLIALVATIDELLDNE
jgi:hypothetical protein